jgi:hypothetical protein
MVKTPPGIKIAGNTGIPEKFNYLVGEIGTAPHRIFDAVQLPGESVEIMDRFMGITRIHPRPFSIPVR